MATRNDCKFYEPIDEVKGNCFGHEVREMGIQMNALQKHFSPSSEI